MKTLKKLLFGLGVGVMLFGSVNALAANYTVVKEPWLDAKMGSTTLYDDSRDLLLFPSVFNGSCSVVYEKVWIEPGSMEADMYCASAYKVDCNGNKISETITPANVNAVENDDSFGVSKSYDTPDWLSLYLGAYSQNTECVENTSLSANYNSCFSFNPNGEQMSLATYESEYWQAANDYGIIFINDFAVVTNGSKVGVINKKGETVVPFEYDFIIPIGSGSNGYTWVLKNNKWGIIRVENNDITVNVNGANVEFDVTPRIINSRTLVPLRAIFQALGATVDWDSTTQTVTSVKGDTTVKMQIGSNTLYKNGNAAAIDVAPQIIENRTLIPVRAIAEAFGNKVDWNSETKTVTIYN